MKLTGKAREKFEDWWFNYMDQEMSIHTFIQQHTCMQFGVYVDFFDSVGIIVSTRNFFDNVKDSCFFMFIISDNKSRHLINHVKENTPFIKTRPEARTKAIEKANELLNERL